MPYVPPHAKILWFDDEPSYLAFRDVCSDPDNFLPYGRWLRSQEDIADLLRAQGTEVIKIYATPAEFVAWCKVNGHIPATYARKHFAIIKSREDT